MGRIKNAKKVNAKIIWLKANNGGRKTRISEGTKYAPIIKFENERKEDKWSAIIIIIKNFLEYSLVELTYLSNKAEFSNLKKGNKFKLYEGPNYVAKGIIL